MPRDATATREALLRQAERLFARRGLYQVQVREIVEAAGQRNVSALNYHFGSREGVLDAILSKHGDPTDLARGELLATVGRDASSRDLVAALVVPYTAHLETPRAATTCGSSPSCRRPSRRGAPWAAARARGSSRSSRSSSRRPDELPVEVRQERVVELIMLMTVAASERARVLEKSVEQPLDAATFAANLTDVLVGVLEAPLRGPLPTMVTDTVVG